MRPAGAGVPDPVQVFAGIARALTESLELPEVLRRIADETLALTEATGVSILLRRGELVEFVAHASPPPGSLVPVGFQFRPTDELVAALANRKEPLVVMDLHQSPLIPAVVKERVFVRDVIIVPLRVDGRMIGVLNIAFNQLPEAWSWDPALLAALADQAAVAVRNAQLYESARTSTEQLMQAEKLSALGRVVARVAHELNNPLTTARLLAESLDIEPLPFPAMELARALGRELEHAAAVVRDLLLFVHRGRPEYADVALAELIRTTVSAQERRLVAAGVTVDLELADGGRILRADPHGLRRILINLLDNATQAMATADDRRIAVRLYEETPDGAWLVLEVEDTGPGIAPEVRARIFEPFFTTKAQGEGTGLGLAIIRSVVEAHGGTIEAAEGRAGGALFRIRLRAVRPAAPAADGGPASPAARREPPRGLRVLIIDDEVELQRALRRVLLHLGCEVTSVLTGEEGLAFARRERYDLILCDIRIPDIHGGEIFRRLRAQAPAAAGVLVFMTGDSLAAEVREFLASTGRPSLAKPFGRTQLEELLGMLGAGAE